MGNTPKLQEVDDTAFATDISDELGPTTVVVPISSEDEGKTI